MIIIIKLLDRETFGGKSNACQPKQILSAKNVNILLTEEYRRYHEFIRLEKKLTRSYSYEITEIFHHKKCQINYTYCFE